MDLEIAGNTALVTASSSGLGKASATALAEAGANVVVNGRDETRLEDTVDEVRDAAAATATVIGHAADLTHPNAGDSLVDQTVDRFGGLDHLVTSTGGPPAMPFLHTRDEDWYDAFDLLVMSAVRTIRAAEPHLKESDYGTIVTIGSLRVKEATDNLVLSNAVRSGVIGLEKTLSKELAPDIRANAVLPGTHRTPRVKKRIENGVRDGRYDSFEAGLEARASNIPLCRLGDPQRLGQAVAFLSSPASAFIAGTAVPIDGGESASTM
ncbi:SDR family oxidoreductase [Halobellus captivus]|uniref:SDR family oxidoreductase n=1 Tax=Halobellus captivus TaxID=2592614 RepID=UPI00119C953A|nr:SDR family oxidoreductase [Halobellus captivus]